MRKTRTQHPRSESDEDSPVRILNRQRARRVDARALAHFARRVLAEIGRDQEQATITFVTDRQIHRLNRTYRSLDTPTDVLSFPDEPEFPHEQGGPQYLGDVVISTETAARYAATYRISFEREVRNLIIHGLLHLCGYDHETDQGEMRQLERRLRRKLSAISRQPSAGRKTPSRVQPDRSHRNKSQARFTRHGVKPAKKLTAES